MCGVVGGETMTSEDEGAVAGEEIVGWLVRFGDTVTPRLAGDLRRTGIELGDVLCEAERDMYL